MSIIVNELCDLLQTHANRDKVVSLTCYTLKLWGASLGRSGPLAASARLAGARSTLRLFDDAAALKSVQLYGLGRHDGPFWGTLGVTNGLLHLAYLQAEKLVWLLDSGIVKVSPCNDGHGRTVHRTLWSAAATVAFIRSLRALNASMKELNSANHRKCAAARLVQASLSTMKLSLDVIHAVSWLPQGWLWGGKLSATQASAAATASAVLALILHYHGKQLVSTR